MGQKITKPRKAKDVELRKIVDKSKEVKGYYYLHELDCGGSMAALLPFRFGKGNRPEYLVRRELIPCWGMDDMCISAITGTADKL